MLFPIEFASFSMQFFISLSVLILLKPFYFLSSLSPLSLFHYVFLFFSDSLSSISLFSLFLFLPLYLSLFLASSILDLKNRPMALREESQNKEEMKLNILRAKFSIRF